MTLVAQNALNQYALRSSLGTSFIERGYRRCYVVIVLAAALLWAFQLLLDPGLVIGLIAATVVSIGVVLASGSALELAETFPELMRVPLLRRLIR